MRVLAWSSNLDPDPAREHGAEPVGKQELFSEADVVTVHYGLGDRSAGLIGRQELSWMKHTAYLVNTSRGPIVDTERAGRGPAGGRIAGAALDVFDREPLPADDPLRTAPRTILTPHIGYVTEETYRIFFGTRSRTSRPISRARRFARSRPERPVALDPRPSARDERGAELACAVGQFRAPVPLPRIANTAIYLVFHDMLRTWQLEA